MSSLNKVFLMVILHTTTVDFKLDNQDVIEMQTFFNARDVTEQFLPTIYESQPFL